MSDKAPIENLELAFTKFTEATKELMDSQNKRIDFLYEQIESMKNNQ